MELPRLLRVASGYSPDVVNLHFHGRLYHDHPMITYVPTALKRLNARMRVVTLLEAPQGARVDRSTASTRAIRKLAARLSGGVDVDYHFGTLLRDSDRIVVLSEVHRAEVANAWPQRERRPC